ncbi:MAG: DUF58 domain-containing protein [Verrucomicrobia bacterium]|nr:DUF58 domain-containing protein [Verrucomicrobiota bacterium]
MSTNTTEHRTPVSLSHPPAFPRAHSTWLQRRLHASYRFSAGFTWWWRRRFTKAGALVFLAIIATGLLGADTNLSLAYQVFVFLCFLFLAALSGSQFSRTRVCAERVLPRFGSAGLPVSYRVTLRNLTPKPQRGLSVTEDLADPRPTLAQFVSTPEPGEERRNWVDRRFYRWKWLLKQNVRGRVTEVPCPALPPSGSADLRLELLPLRRGVLRFDAVAVACPDTFGLFRTFIPVPLPQSLLILPKRYFVPPLALAGQLKYQQGGVALAASVGESEEFVSLRDYRPGDALRHIHWPSWAKTGKPIVKEFQDEFFTRHALILDTFLSVAASEVFEEAVSVAASLACTVQAQESLLDLMFVGPQAYCFTMGRGVGHLEQLLEILASVQPCRDRQFKSLLQLVLQHAGDLSGCLCVFVEWDEQRREFVRRLREMGVPLTVFVVTNAGAPKPDPGPMGADPEQFRQLEVGKVAEGLANL